MPLEHEYYCLSLLLLLRTETMTTITKKRSIFPMIDSLITTETTKTTMTTTMMCLFCPMIVPLLTTKTTMVTITMKLTLNAKQKELSH